jgi:predicted Zn-dependent protease
MLKAYGADALAKMLAAYADNLTTKEALRRSFGVEQAEFEKGYGEYLRKIVADLPPPAAAQSATLEQLQQQLAADPASALLLAQVAQGRFNRRQYAEARRLADAALKIDAVEPLANYVRARLHLLVGEDAQAIERLQGSLDRAAPQADHLGLLAALRLKAGDLAEASRLYELGAQHEPWNKKWAKSLCAVYLKSGDKRKLSAVLEQLAAADPEDLPMRKKLAELALAENDLPRAERFAKQALQIDVQDAEVHRMLAAALAGQKQPAAAIEEFETAIELRPDQGRWRLDLARAYAQNKQADKARAILQALRKQDFNDPEVDELLQSLGQ